MIHHPSGAARGQASDMNREVREWRVCVCGGGGDLLPARSVCGSQQAADSLRGTRRLCSPTPPPPPPPPQARELMRIRDYMDGILSEATGQPFDKVC